MRIKLKEGIERAKGELASEEKYRSLFNSIDTGFCIIEVLFNENEVPYDYRFLEANTEFEKQTGLIDAVGKTMKEMVDGHEQHWFDIYGRIAKTGKAEHFEKEAKALGIYYEVHAFPFGEPEENRVGVLFNNITERKQAEEKIKESEHRFHELIYSSPSMMAILKREDMIIEIANDAILTSWGKGKDIIGKSIFLVLPEVVEQGFDKSLLNVYKTGEPFHAYETPVTLLRNGISEIIYYNFVYQAHRNINGEIEGVAILANEVTPQALVNKKIKVSEEKFKQLVQQAPMAICVLRGEDYVIETMNEGMSVFWDRTVDQALNKPVFDVLPETRDQGIKELLDNVYFTGERCVVEELSIEIMRNGRLENAFVKFVYEPLREADGSISGVMALAHEITEQVLARKKVEESEKQFEAAILAVEGVIWTNSTNGEMIGEQPGWAKLTGQHFEEYQGHGWAKAIHPDDAQPTVDAWNKAVATNSTFEFEHRIKTNQNAWRHFSVKAVPVLDENGIIQRWVGVHIDITEQKLAEEKLAYRTALLEAHNEASVDGLLLVDVKGKILSFNQRFVEIWNMPKHIVNDKDDEAALSFAMTQLVYPQQFIDKVKYFYDHPTETSLDELEFKDGKVVERNGYAVIGVDGTYYAWSWTFKDITERKRIEQDLKNTQEQLELTFKNIPAGVYLINAKGEMVYLNDRGAAIYGDFTPESILEHKDLSTLLKIADELFERFDENGYYFSAQNSPAFISLTTGKPSQAILKQINKITREQRWYYVQGAPLFDEKGNVSLVLITSTDITEQKNAEEEIKYSEERFRSLAQTLPQLVWVTDGQGNSEFASTRWKEYTGIEPVGEKEWKAIVHPDDLDSINAAWMHCLATGNTYNCDVRLKSKNGEYRWHTVMGEPVLDSENKIAKWVGAFTDTHQEKLFTQELELKVKERTNELEEFNIELEKKNKELESFAYISSHDLQEPLRKIQILATRIIERESLSEIGRDNFSRMQLAAKRMQTLIEDLLTYSKTNTDERKFENTNLNIIIDDVKEDLSEEIKGKNATIEAAELGDIKIIPFQFRQLMHNLIGNALKFSVPNRIPHIQIKSVIAYGRQLNNEKLKSENRYCHITVSDNGIGFEQQYSEKIFEVFQRLHGKNEYQGTGIGLAIVKKIVDNHEGIITADSELNKGTTFNIYIPIR